MGDDKAYGLLYLLDRHVARCYFRRQKGDLYYRASESPVIVALYPVFAALLINLEEVGVRLEIFDWILKNVVGQVRASYGRPSIISGLEPMSLSSMRKSVTFRHYS